MTTKLKRHTIVLFDAHAILHRAYHAIPDFTTASGEPTGALYGLANLVVSTIKTFHPFAMIACYDLPGGTFRHETYKAYKGKRPEIDEPLVAQIVRSREVFSAFGVPSLDAKGFEADDVIGTLAEQLKKDVDIIIVSGDMDTLQLVDNTRVRVFTLKKGINDTIIYDEEAVKNRYGFLPVQLTDYKGLRGDPSDNIIGIPGIGEKTGTALVTTFSTIEHMYEVLKKKNGEEKFKDAGISPRITALIREHEEDARFSKMLATIRRDAPVSYAIPEKSWEDTWKPEDAIPTLEKLEFRSLKARIGQLGKEAIVKKGEEQTQENLVPQPEATDLPPEVRIAIWLLDSDISNATNEDVERYEGKNLIEKFENIKKEIQKKGLQKVYEEIELPLIPLIKEAQEKGILIDTEFLKNLSVKYHKELNKVSERIFSAAGETFNINSPKQLGVILFDKLALTAKGLRKTEGGARSTRESELEKLKDTHPIIGHILQYRELQKLLSTYIDVIPMLVDKEGRLHTTLHQTGAATGRMSSSNPGLQNIPVREGLGTPIREAFIVPKGKVLLASDYSQIEMRVLAVLSGDKALQEIFKSRNDVHTSVAARVFKVAPSDVTKEMRRRAKVINFGIIYGMGVSALQKSLGSTRAEAQTFYDDYLSSFPEAANYLEQIIADAKINKYTTTLFGRRRQVRDIASKIPFIRAAAERMAKNAPIQGTAADLIKLAMIRVDEALQKEKLKDSATLLLQVHDELIYEVDEGKVGAVAQVVRRAMEGVYPDTPIPLEVSVKIGLSWGKMDEAF